MQEQKNEYWSRRKSTITVKFVIKIVYRTSRASNFPSWYLWRKLYENPGLTYSESFLAARTHCGKLFLETNQIHGFSQTFSRGRDFWTPSVCSRIFNKPWIDVNGSLATDARIYCKTWGEVCDFKTQVCRDVDYRHLFVSLKSLYV